MHRCPRGARAALGASPLALLGVVVHCLWSICNSPYIRHRLHRRVATFRHRHPRHTLGLSAFAAVYTAVHKIKRGVDVGALPTQTPTQTPGACTQSSSPIRQSGAVPNRAAIQRWTHRGVGKDRDVAFWESEDCIAGNAGDPRSACLLARAAHFPKNGGHVSWIIPIVQVVVAKSLTWTIRRPTENGSRY